MNAVDSNFVDSLSITSHTGIIFHKLEMRIGLVYSGSKHAPAAA